MNPGRELDALVAEKVMGWRWFPVSFNPGQSVLAPSPNEAVTIQVGDSITHLVPNYSTDIAAAWEVVEKIGLLKGTRGSGENGGDRVLSQNCYDGTWEVAHVLYEDWEFLSKKCESAPHAICLAALKAVGVETK